MNRTRNKIYLLIAAVMVLGAFVIVAIHSVRKEEAKNMNEVTGSFQKDEVRNLDFRCGACEITFEEGDSFNVAYKGFDEDEIVCKLQNGCLFIKTEKEKKFFSIFKWSDRNDRKIRITLPKDASFDEVNMEYGAAEVTMKSIVAKEMQLEVGAGSLHAEELTATSKAKIKVGAGEMYITNGRLSNATIDTGVGEFVYNGNMEGDSDLKCGVGNMKIVLNGQSESDYHGELDCGLGNLNFGEITINGAGKRSYGADGKNRLDVDCGVGNVTVRFE